MRKEMSVEQIQKDVNIKRGIEDIIIVSTELKKATESSNRRTRYVDFYFVEDEDGEIFTRCLKHFTKTIPNIKSCKNKNLKTEKYTKESFNKVLQEVKPDVELIGDYVNKFTKTKFRNNKCGHIFENIPHTMHFKSVVCPICSITSFGELMIREFLLSKNINFQEQKTFDDMVYKSKLRIDFYLEDFNTAIEFQGRQHFENTISNFRDSEGFDVIKARDNAKFEFCLKNDIKLVYLDYTMIDRGYLTQEAINILESIIDIKDDKI